MKQLFLLRNEAIRNNAIDAILSLPIDDKSPHEVHVKEPKRIDATMCAIIAWFIRDLLVFAGLSSNLAYIASVFIGYIGTDSIGSLIKRFAAKKAGVEDGGNQ